MIRSIAFVLGMLSCAAAVAQEPIAEDAPPASPKQPVNLIEVAELEFAPAAERYDDWESWPATWAGDFLVLVDQQGKPTYCEPVELENATELSGRLCNDLMANAKVNILPGYSLGGREGIVAISKQPMVVIPGLAPSGKEGSSPFSFGISELGPSAFVDYEPLRSFEAVETPGVGTKPPKTFPTYPSFSLRERHQGSTGLVIAISVEAEITSCRPIESSGYARLDNAACSYVLEHMEADLSETSPEAAAPYYFPFKITWKIPEE